MTTCQATLEESAAADNGDARPVGATSAEFNSRKSRTRSSALWGAYGDALGWISELTDSNGLKMRTGGVPLRRPVEWKRRIGGRFGVSTLLPKGCYSDDSQLRLATGRAIGPNGFDVEAFAKVELPVWLSYGLGGGKATSAAADNLCRRTVPWFANTFYGWTNSGGNGAAMRIQPHVWSASDLNDPNEYLLDVVRNSICTHSHPIGLLGSVVHAMAVARALSAGHNPSFDELLEFTRIAADLPKRMKKDIEVGNYWCGAFERESGDFESAWCRAIEECEDAVKTAGECGSGKRADERYASLIDRLKLQDPARRGSGMLSAVASVGLLWCEADPEEAMRIAANEVGTDTDTIASMAGSIVGATVDSEPPTEVLDADLFRSEADRLTETARGKQPKSHQYPDLLHWAPPSKRADWLVRTSDGDLHVRGLGYAQARDEPIPSRNSDFLWQWVSTESGQSLFIKRRAKLEIVNHDKDLRAEQGVLKSPLYGGDDDKPKNVDKRKSNSGEPKSVVSRGSPKSPTARSRPLDLQRAVDFVIANIDKNEAIGIAVRRVVQGGNQGQIAVFFAALINELKDSGQKGQENCE